MYKKFDTLNKDYNCVNLVKTILLVAVINNQVNDSCNISSIVHLTPNTGYKPASVYSLSQASSHSAGQLNNKAQRGLT